MVANTAGNHLPLGDLRLEPFHRQHGRRTARETDGDKDGVVAPERRLLKPRSRRSTP